MATNNPQIHIELLINKNIIRNLKEIKANKTNTTITKDNNILSLV